MQGHPDVNRLPEVNLTSGALGQGLSFSIGLALSKKIKDENGYIYCLLGDGEIQEGSVWEAAMAAAHHELGNLNVILDRNRIQNDDFCETQMRMFDIPAKWRSFGWNVKEINGHDMNEILEGLDFLSSSNDGPSILIAHTVKGNGISYMADNPAFHGAAPNDEQYHQAMVELGEVSA